MAAGSMANERPAGGGGAGARGLRLAVEIDTCGGRLHCTLQFAVCSVFAVEGFECDPSKL